MARHEHSFGIPSVEGFNGDDRLLKPTLVGALCSAGKEINDLNIGDVLGSHDGNLIKEYIKGVVSTIVDIETAKPKGEAPDTESRDSALQIVEDEFTALVEPDNNDRSVTIHVPYVDVHGVRKVLVAAAVANLSGAVAAGLHTEIAASYNQ